MSEDPFKTIRGEPVFLSLQKADPELARCAQEAQTTLPTFCSLYQQYRNTSGVYFAFKVAIQDGDQRAHLWYSLMEERGGLWFGEHFELPPELAGHKKIQVTRDQIEDWMINDHGVLYGGLTLRYQRSRLPENEKASFDEYAGIREYKELS